MFSKLFYIIVIVQTFGVQDISSGIRHWSPLTWSLVQQVGQMLGKGDFTQFSAEANLESLMDHFHSQQYWSMQQWQVGQALDLITHTLSRTETWAGVVSIYHDQIHGTH